MKLWPNLPGLRVALTWSVREEVSVALDMEPDGSFNTCVYYYESELGLSIDTHTDFSVAVERVKRLLAGSWRDYFDEQMLARFDAEKEQI